MTILYVILLSFILTTIPRISEIEVVNPFAYLIADKGEVYEGTITGITTFYGMSTQGLSPSGYYITLDTYPDTNFEFSLKNGLKWGFVVEITPGLTMVNSEKCKGWYVRLNVNSKMVVTKCKIISYGDEEN